MKPNKKLIIPSILTVGIYLLSYSLPKLIVSNDSVHYLTSKLDNYIPFVPVFIFIYIGAFFQWLNAILFLNKQETKKAYRYLNAVNIGSIIGLLFYIIYPTAVVRPEIFGNNAVEQFCKIIFTIDTPINAFPSFHCFLSFITVVFYIDFKANKNTIIFNSIYSILVFISTLLTKQHVIVDIPAGIMLGIVSLMLSKYISFDKLFDYLNNKFNA